jgi:hypothetical protein
MLCRGYARKISSWMGLIWADPIFDVARQTGQTDIPVYGVYAYGVLVLPYMNGGASWVEQIQ